MKTKRLFLAFLSALLVVTMSLFAFACKKDLEPTFLRIDSAAECTIEIGQEYTLMYTTQGEVTVTASGGKYDAETKKFTADAEGEYTLTVKAVEEGKAETSNQVKITVSKGADRTALKTAIDKTNGLIQSDYTNITWTAVTNAKKVANDLLGKFGTSQDTVNETVKDLEDKIAALVPVEIAKASEVDGNLKNGTTVYFAEDYENMAAVLEKVEELNADTTVKLNSVYASKLKAIIDTLVARPSLTVKGAPNGVMLVSELVPFEITAEAEEGAKLEWKLNGAAVTTGLSEDGKKFTYTPAAFGEAYKIEVTATVGEGESAKTRTLTYEGSFAKITHKTNLDGVTVDKNVISSEQVGWGDAKGRKAVLEGLTFSGDVTVYFDLMFEQIGNPAVMGIFFLNASGQDINNWAVVSAANGFIEVATEDEQAKKVRVDSNTTEMNKTYHFMAKRTVKEGKGYLSMYMLDDNGNIIVENTGNNIAKDYAGPVMLGIQTENSKGKVFNISVSSDTVINDKTELRALVTEIGTVDTADYKAEVKTAFDTALANAKTLLNNDSAEKTALDAAVAALKAARADLKPENYATVVKAVIVSEEEVETGFEFDGEEYLIDDYKNIAAILIEIKALNANTEIVQNSVYKAEIAKIIAKLQPVLELTSANADLEKAMIVSEFEELTFNATSSEGATFAWKLNGEVAGTGAQFKFTPDHNGEYKVEVTATKEGKVNSQQVTVSVHKFAYEINYETPNGISVKDGVIKVEAGFGWGLVEGKKVYIPDLAITGDFDASFDLKFTEHRGDAGNANVFALFFLNENGDKNADWVAVCQHSGKLEVARGGDGPEKPQTDLFKQPFTFDENGNPVEPVDTTEGAENNNALKAGSFEIGKVWTIKVERRIVEDRAFTVAYVYDEDGNLVAYNKPSVGKNYTGAIRFGFQSENVSFELSNFEVKNVDAKVVDRTELGLLVNTANKLTLSDYVDTKELVAALISARDTYKANTTQKSYDEAYAKLDAALNALELKTIEKAELLSTSFGYNGVSYEADGYTNFLAIVGKITALNEDATIKTVSQYDAAIKAILAELVAKFEVKVEGITEGNLIVNELVTYNLTASAAVSAPEAQDDEPAPAPAYTWAWAVNGKPVANATAATFAFTPEEFGAYSVVATATAADGTVISKEVKVSFIQATFTGRANDAPTPVENNSFKIPEGIGWGHWEGRNAILDDLAFNGSFSITTDIEWTSGNGTQVVTTHLLNTDTLSPNFGGDHARISYGAICLHNHILELGGGVGRTRTDDGDVGGTWEQARPKLNAAAAAGLFEHGKTLTFKLTVLRNNQRQYRLIVSLWDTANNEWIDFTKSGWYGDFSGAFTVSHNVEGAGVTLKNYRYELLEATDDYVAGSVQSKVAFHNALDEFAELDASEYENVDMFFEAYDNAKAEFCNNRATADYAGALAELEAAYEALVERTVKAGVSELDKGFTALRGISSLTVAGEDVTAENVSWSYKFLEANAEEDDEPEAKTFAGATLALTAGEYSEVKVTVGDKVISYQDFKVEALNLKANVNQVTLNEDKTVATVKRGDGWGSHEQLVIDGVWGTELELTFKAAAHIGANGGNFRIFGINLFGTDVREVFGVREGNQNRFQYGPDGQLGEVFKDGDEATFNAIFGAGKTDEDWGTENDNAFTYSLKVSRIDLAKYSVTFTVYKADGTVYVSKTTEHSLNHMDSTTALRFYFEDIDIQLSDFTVMYR